MRLIINVWLTFGNSIETAAVVAIAAFNANILINVVNFFPFAINGFNRAFYGTNGTSGTLVGVNLIGK